MMKLNQEGKLMKINTILKATILCSLLNTAVFADDITDQITIGLEAYKEQDYKTALEELKFVTAQIQQLNQEEMQKLMPKALEGWTEKESSSRDNQVAMSMMGGGTSMKSVFQRNREKVTVEVLANSPMMQMMTMMMKNPAMMAGQKNTKPYRYKKAKGMIKTEKNKTEISLVLAGQILVKVSGRKLEDDAVLKQYLEQLDFSKLKDALL